jgi:hypothetical protein
MNGYLTVYSFQQINVTNQPTIIIINPVNLYPENHRVLIDLLVAGL